jgi:hypothetical protein
VDADCSNVLEDVMNTTTPHIAAACDRAGEACEMAPALQDCPECGNGYLAIRTDVYQDQRDFIYCDVCGCLADRRVWNRITPKETACPR